jgi:predicted methyltransferase
LDILAALEVKPGMRVADVGAGTGLYTMLFADAVGPTGTVYAVDMAARANEAGLKNVVPVLSLETSTELPPGTVDLVFMADTYHH